MGTKKKTNDQVTDSPPRSVSEQWDDVTAMLSLDCVDTRLAAVRTLHSDLMGALLTAVKQMEQPWHKTTQELQEALLERWHTAMTEAALRAVIVGLAGDKPKLAGQVSTVAFKGETVKCTFTAGRNSSARHELADREGGCAVLVLVDDDEWGMGELPGADPDQPELDGVTDTPETERRAAAYAPGHRYCVAAREYIMNCAENRRDVTMAGIQNALGLGRDRVLDVLESLVQDSSEWAVAVAHLLESDEGAH